MTVLEDIQNNVSEFNIAFHLQEIIGAAMVATFDDEDNRKAVEAATKIKTSPQDLRAFIIGNMFREFVQGYLKEPFDGEEDASELED